MNTILRLMKADFIKLKRTSFYWIHICVPVIGIFIFLWYFSFSLLSSTSKVQAYLEAISLTFPLIIGIVTSMVVEQESMAGGFKEILGTEYGKGTCLISKVLVLLCTGFLSTILAIGIFFIGFQYVLKQNTLTLNFYIYQTVIIFGSQIFLYLFHLWVSFVLGNGGSIGIGIFESLTSALMLTGLGDVLWKWIPCSWGVRFSDYFTVHWLNLGIKPNELASIYFGTQNSIVLTILLGILFGVWFKFYEGTKYV
ncbi:multidrug ABC transporter permease [Clostridium botulinum]|uniref:lantibiotic immunity ABC transporter MutG family permease subunit n=1 Tax=Clostridium TaxID=1485 RepID=UPI000174E14E|nr:MULTISPECIES: lantibiotic immunity ABC transporter MutG family permease subunit [Clostridium]ACD52865.1 putative lantibiotic ABC transporter, permease protein [Clostridium botulinum E3 str. Alaska E43]AJF29941.1 multidrug ABC transporter permease [Clostridium botulinum]AJF33004.1 multidrug ABC transporter permease [Clostridium botulinum]MBN1042291.1 lantibiotic immunity ABC transporter MutG family permease subunit [Clostridium botulinum]MBY6788874.1 lantibiotic immunity ABC transporter MutG